MATRNGRGIALAGVIGAAVVAAVVLVPGMRVGATQPWLGALVIVVPTAALLAATGYRHYGLARALAIAVSVSVLAGAVSWVVAVFTLVKALSGEGVGLAWAVLLFLTPVVSVLAPGTLALRLLRPAAE
ncbi:hypothetical protein ABGB19_20560 [Mycobacterium sp. B14F4]|uniref:hypothetical protein n=1 Tax=Mycobacterium sp. B14F4 TaxID=3153565 RepID=UPI00325CDB13